MELEFDFNPITAPIRGFNELSNEAHESVKESKGTTYNKIYECRSLDNLPNEKWKQIIGYEGFYEISSLGRVKSVERITVGKNGISVTNKSMIKKQRQIKGGYLTVYLFRGKFYHHKSVHVLVATHFIDNPENKPQVNHKLGIKTDNRHTQLEWCSASENAVHAYKYGLMCQKGEKHNSHKLTNVQVLEIFKSTEIQQKIADKYMVSKGTVANIKQGLGWTHITGKNNKKNKNL